MLISYTQESSLSEAVTDTFSGEKPCCLCKKLATVKASESGKEKKNQPLLSASNKLFQDLYPPTIPTLRDPLSNPFPPTRFAPVAGCVSTLASGPPSPPPRC